MFYLIKSELKFLALIGLISSQIGNLALAQWGDLPVPRRPCKDLICLRAQEIKDYIDFPSSPLKPIVKVTVSYCKMKSAEACDEQIYETLWYRGANPIGCRRYRDFDILPLDNIYIWLGSSTGAENAAGANAVIRLLFEAILNRNLVTAVEVPSDSFKEINSCFEKENFFTPANLPFRPEQYIYLTLIDDIGDQQTRIFAGI